MKSKKILIDTNILIYAWDQRDKMKQQKAIETLEFFRNQAYLSAQNLTEFSAVMLKHNCSYEWLQKIIKHYTSVMKVLSLTESDILKAIQAVEQYQMSYWDAQIWAVARTNQIDTIFSEDGPIGQTIEGVTYINPLN